MTAVPFGLLVLLAIIALTFLGLTERVLRRMRLSNPVAIILLLIMIAGFFLPEVTIFPSVGIDLGGALVPLGVALYLIVTADSKVEKSRAILATVAAGALVYASDIFLHDDPGYLFFYDIDPLYIPGIVGGIAGYLAGRSRRSAFIAGVGSVIISDVFAGLNNLVRGVRGAVVGIGGAGAFDAVIIAGVLAVVLAEVVGETREFFARARGNKGGDGSDGSQHRRRSGGSKYSVQQQGRDGISTLSIGMVLLLSGAVIVGSSYYANVLGVGIDERPIDGRYFTMIDETTGTIVMQTGRVMTVGDEYISQDNVHYRIVAVEGLRATAQRLGAVDLLDDSLFTMGRQGLGPPLETEESDPDIVKTQIIDFFRLFQAPDQRPDVPGDENDDDDETQDKGIIGIYHTHNDESYVRTSGTHSVYGQGGVHSVGGTLAEELRKDGFTVVHSNNLHLPHDRGAYRRSRRTAAQILREPGPIIAMFDVHRDAAPPGFYGTRIEDMFITQVRLVVGRQNPGRSGNIRFAMELKALADQMFPGLIKDIFHAHGNYNQDIGPRMILLELGAHTNSRAAAQNGIKLFSQVIDRYFTQRMEGAISEGAR